VDRQVSHSELAGQRGEVLTRLATMWRSAVVPQAEQCQKCEGSAKRGEAMVVSHPVGADKYCHTHSMFHAVWSRAATCPQLELGGARPINSVATLDLKFYDKVPGKQAPILQSGPHDLYSVHASTMGRTRTNGR
jgi:hypothetical protein